MLGAVQAPTPTHGGLGELSGWREPRPASVEMAIRLSKAFGSTPETWLGMQNGPRPLAGPRPSLQISPFLRVYRVNPAGNATYDLRTHQVIHAARSV